MAEERYVYRVEPNIEHLSILRQGVPIWNDWRAKNYEVWPNLSGADLSSINLNGINFRRTILYSANLRRTVLERANLIEADLRGAKLDEANLNDAKLGTYHWGGADLGSSNLHSANLTRANLTGVNLAMANLDNAILVDAYINAVDFNGTYLKGADFSFARLNHATFGYVDLSVVKGLETVVHEVPSTIGIDTIYLSKGNIPEVFLRGCGVPDTFIEFSRSLVGKPIDFYSCFISHSGKDRTFCERLYADLQAKGVRVWYFPEDAKWGESVWGEIDRSIRIYDKLIVVCSKNSLTSGPVLREIERALRREDEEGKNILFPITIDDYIFDEWEHPRKADVLAQVVGDFRGWNRSADKYDAAFTKLLKALKAGQ